MIVECPGCRSRYDVTGRPPGTQARCRCGTVFALPAPEERAEKLSCPSCGGGVSAGDKNCTYCEAELLLKACPRCFARVFHGAAHCSHCGAPVEAPAKVTQDGEAETRHCPACRDGTDLQGRLAGEVLLDECPECHGVFLDAEALDRIVREREAPSMQDVAGVSGDRGDLRPERPPPLPPGRAMYIPCPDCDNMMNRKNFGKRSGIIVDYCKSHGTWFDAGELPHVIQFVTSGGLDEARAKEAEEQRRSAQRPAVSAAGAFERHAMHPMEQNVSAFERLLASVGRILRDS